MRYFPEPISGWIFLVALLSLLGVAAYTDQRSMKVPKWLTLSMLGLGLLANMLRGGWLAANGQGVWYSTNPGVAVGALDGLWFALAGFLLAFVMFFGMWILGVCGGGDVKLFAGVGAWIGPVLMLGVLATSLVLLMVYMVGLLGYRLLTGRALASLSHTPRRRGQDKAAASPRLLVRYSLLVALAAAPVLLWAFRADLRLMDRPTSVVASGVSRNAH